MKHMIIPDCQVRDGDDFGYLERIGHYLVEKQPDKVVCLGDFADLPSLSSYDVGKKAFEGRRYRLDVQAVHRAMETLLAPLQAYNRKAIKNHKERYNPELILTLGNHENRINRAVNDDPKLDGTIGVGDLGYEEFGWKVHPFLDVVVVDGIAYSHYFTTGLLGRPCTTASAQLAKKHMSCVAGHQQGLQIATAHRADGARLTSIISGSCYEHNEDYLSSQGNNHWRGLLMLHDIKDGQFDVMSVSLDYLRKKYDN
jgi:hypothetical protein